MLTITIPDTELFNEETEEFITVKGATLRLEHSLVSISKWESKWCKPFLGKDAMTDEEILDYVRCMTITQNVNPEVFKYLTKGNIEEISKYINAPMTATKVPKENGSTAHEIVTSELIYYWMISLQIPVEFQTWHLNRLLSLIEVCNFKSKPPKKMSRREILERNRALNAQRRAKYNTKG